MQESFVDCPVGTDFPLQNLPWGVFQDKKEPEGKKRVGIALGEHVIDVTTLQEAGLLSGPSMSGAINCFAQGSLNAFMGLGRAWWHEARTTLQRLLSSSEGALRDNTQLRSRAILAQADVSMQLPAHVGDYTDFYTSRHHAFNVGALFRGPGQELQPNWVHLPVGYHGRASSIIMSGEDVHRPRGQVKPAAASTPSFVPCAALDYELEMGAFIGPGNKQGEPITMSNARDHIFGYVLLNDWSARDIQSWEYVPLGPFNSKNFVDEVFAAEIMAGFYKLMSRYGAQLSVDDLLRSCCESVRLALEATQISPWVVTLDALEPFMTAPPVQDPTPLHYLRHPASQGPNTIHDIQLSVDLIPAGHTQSARLSTTNLKYTYWTFEQMLAHHTAGGCNMRPGDLLGSGTLSGPEPHQRACLLELTLAGKQPLQLELSCQDPQSPSAQKTSHATASTSSQEAEAGASTKLQRAYLQDGDTIVMRGWCEREGVARIGFGECRGKILPCPEYPSA